MDIIYKNRFRIEPELKVAYVAPDLQINEPAKHEPRVKLLVTLENMKFHLFRGVSPDITVVHSATEAPEKNNPSKKLQVGDHTEEMVWAQRRLHDAIGRLEDRLLSRINRPS